MSSIKNKIISAALCLMILFPVMSQAQNMRIGYMNPQKVLNALPEKAVIQKKLNAYLQQKQKDYSKKAADLQTQIQAYQKKKASMSKAENQKEQSRLNNLTQNLDKYRSSIQDDLQTKRSQLLSPVLDRINKAIKSVADSMNLDFVLNKETSQGETILMYVSQNGKQKFDITQKVIDKLTNK
ncbi:MAG TPA: OmpH family outer membrane protein [Balneolales bacterium]|nr:OmpH family outer membrane protein [Balneolales bacterium]